jgi:hypothetical protein
MRAVFRIKKKKSKKLKRVFFEKSQKSAFLTKNGRKSYFFPEIPFGNLFFCHLKLNLAILY